ncbi:hypothetical protein ACJX0J_012264, partial [Zea mays]
MTKVHILNWFLYLHLVVAPNVYFPILRILVNNHFDVKGAFQALTISSRCICSYDSNIFMLLMNTLSLKNKGDTTRGLAVISLSSAQEMQA